MHDSENVTYTFRETGGGGGYNLILQVPREMGDEVRKGWPPGAAPASNWQRAAGAVPAQLSIPVHPKP